MQISLVHATSRKIPPWIQKNTISKSKFYQSSTSELYGNVNSNSQNENTPFNPCSPYSISKHYAYNITKNFSTGEKLQGPEPKQVIYFLAESTNKNVTLSFEHQEFGWFSFIEAREKLKNTKKYKVLNSVIQFFIDKKYL